MQNEITWSHFTAIDMRVGTILKVVSLKKPIKRAYILHIDFGKLGIKKTSAQITELYSEFELLNKQIIAIINFPKKQIANIMSECLVLGVLGNDKDVILLNPDRRVENGLKIG